MISRRRFSAIRHMIIRVTNRHIVIGIRQWNKSKVEHKHNGKYERDECYRLPLAVDDAKQQRHANKEWVTECGDRTDQVTSHFYWSSQVKSSQIFFNIGSAGACEYATDERYCSCVPLALPVPVLGYYVSRPLFHALRTSYSVLPFSTLLFPLPPSPFSMIFPP